MCSVLQNNFPRVEGPSSSGAHGPGWYNHPGAFRYGKLLRYKKELTFENGEDIFILTSGIQGCLPKERKEVLVRPLKDEQTGGKRPRPSALPCSSACDCNSGQDASQLCKWETQPSWFLYHS